MGTRWASLLHRSVRARIDIPWQWQIGEKRSTLFTSSMPSREGLWFGIVSLLWECFVIGPLLWPHFRLDSLVHPMFYLAYYALAYYAISLFWITRWGQKISFIISHAIGSYEGDAFPMSCREGFKKRYIMMRLKSDTPPLPLTRIEHLLTSTVWRMFIPKVAWKRLDGFRA